MTRSVKGLSIASLPGQGYGRQVWYRAVRVAHAANSLAWHHTRTQNTRFKHAAATFPLLYFAPDSTTALLEVRALLGHPRIGSLVPLPGSWLAVKVVIRLDRVADLRTAGERTKIPTTAQELTGDWLDYTVRTARSSEVSSSPPAPTQQIGEVLYRQSNCQGFLAPSAKNSVLPNLVVFPDRVTIDQQNLVIKP